MTDHPRIRNLAMLIVLVLIYIIPAFFVSPDRMLDLASGPMMVFAIYALFLLAPEAWSAYWEGQSDRTAYALFGLSLLLTSIVTMRGYGLLTRNVEGLEWLENSYVYSAAIYAQFVGVFLFSQASTPPTVSPRRAGMGHVIAGVVIGILVASSKMLEPLLAMIGKVLGRVF